MGTPQGVKVVGRLRFGVASEREGPHTVKANLEMQVWEFAQVCTRVSLHIPRRTPHHPLSPPLHETALYRNRIRPLCLVPNSCPVFSARGSHAVFPRPWHLRAFNGIEPKTSQLPSMTQPVTHSLSAAGAAACWQNHREPTGALASPVLTCKGFFVLMAKTWYLK